MFDEKCVIDLIEIMDMDIVIDFILFYFISFSYFHISTFEFAFEFFSFAFFVTVLFVLNRCMFWFGFFFHDYFQENNRKQRCPNNEYLFQLKKKTNRIFFEMRNKIPKMNKLKKKIKHKHTIRVINFVPLKYCFFSC